MIRRLMEYALLAVALSLPLTACDGDGTEPQQGTVDVLLTDAPGDFHSAIVTISSIYFQGEGEDGTRFFLVGDANTSANITVDLVDLANDVRELARDKAVPVGTYSQLRIVLSGGCIEVEQSDGSTKTFASSGYTACGAAEGTLQMPSLAQTGIKINLPGGAFEVTGGDQALLVDFDVSQSFGQQAGQSGLWVMNPVINATNAELTGSATVTLKLGAGVSLPSGVSLTGFQARLSSSEGSVEDLALTDANADGTFEATFRFLFAGSYSVTFVPPTGITSFSTQPTVPASVTVQSGATATSNFTLTAAS